MNKAKQYFKFALQKTDFSLEKNYQLLQKNCPHSGAIICFTGIVRDSSKLSTTVSHLELQTYKDMALKQMEELGQEILKRFNIEGLDIIHRYGKLTPLEQIVYVGVAGKHRNEAYMASKMTMDYLKTKVAFWKKEYYSDNTDPRWIEPSQLDFESLQNWSLDE